MSAKNETIPVKRIALLRNAYAHQMGGAEVFTYNLAAELQKNGLHVTVVSSQKTLRDKCHDSDITTIGGWWAGWLQQLSGVRNVLLILFFPYVFLRTIWLLWVFASRRIQVVHAHSRDDFIAGTIAAKLLGRKIIWTDHADLKHVFLNHTVWFKNIPGKFLHWIARRSKVVITVVSNSELQAIEAHIGTSLAPNLRVAYGGVIDHLAEYANVTPQKNVVTIGIVSRLVTDKGVFELFDAFKRLRATHEDIRLVVVGDGPARAQLEAENIATFVGYTASPLEHIATFDIFAYPTYHEGLSMSLMEACMMQRCIVSTNVGGNPEIITNNEHGLLVAPRDADALVRALEQCISSPDLRQKLAVNARQRFTQTFDFSVTVKETFIPLYNA